MKLSNVAILLLFFSFSLTLMAEDECFNLIDQELSNKTQREFNRLYKREKIEELIIKKRLAEKINKTSFIFTTGFLSNLQAPIGSKNFDNLIKGMKEFCSEFKCTFDYRHSLDFGMHTVTPVKKNAPIVEAMINDVRKNRGDDREIIVIGHSKGGLDITEAMLNLMQKSKTDSNDLTEHIKVITISTPYKGSPLADKMTHGKKGDFSSLLLPMIGSFDGAIVRNKKIKVKSSREDSLESLKDLTSEVRNQFITDHCQDLKKISEKYISFTAVSKSNLLKDCSNPFTMMLAPFKVWLDRITKSSDNDGLVTRESQQFGTVVHLDEDVEHTGLVMSAAHRPSKGAIDVFLSLIAVSDPSFLK